MKRIALLSIIFSSLFFSGCTIDLTNKTENLLKNSKLELQSKCSKDSDVFFQKQKDGDFYADDSYINHYNVKMDKCFILITRLVKDNNNQYNGHITKSLVDVYEDRGIGFFYDGPESDAGCDKNNMCSFNGISIKSKDDFNNKVKDYMEN